MTLFHRVWIAVKKAYYTVDNHVKFSDDFHIFNIIYKVVLPTSDEAIDRGGVKWVQIKTIGA